MWRPVAPRLLRRFLLLMAAYLLLAMAPATGFLVKASGLSPDVGVPFLIFVGVFFLLALVAAAYATEQVLKPLGDLLQGKPGEGGGSPAPVASDELSDVATRFEHLAERIRTLETQHAEQQTEIQKLSQEIELQSQSLANVSHELRTPLTSIVGYSEILAEELSGILTVDAGEHLKTIIRNANVLLSLINNLLDFSRLKAGKLEMTWTSVLIGEVIESAFDMVEPQLKAKGLKFVVDLPDTPIAVQGSFERLRQVIVNLLSNAVKFTDHGEVGVSAVQADGSVEVKVWDSGIGVDAAQLPFIFDEFRQADGSIRRKYGGSGLGLAICRSIIETHNGEITAQSVPSEGTRITVRLPAPFAQAR